MRVAASRPSLSAAVALDTLLPVSGTRFFEFGDELNGTIAAFGPALASTLLPAIRTAGGTAALTRINYVDRYLQSPLVVRLMTEALTALRDALAIAGATLPLLIVTNPFRANDRQPFAPDHDWQWNEDRRAVLLALPAARGFAVELDERGAAHGRTITLTFADRTTVRIVLDQGFGVWRTPRFARFAFGDPADRQAAKIETYSALIEARGLAMRKHPLKAAG